MMFQLRARLTNLLLGSLDALVTLFCFLVVLYVLPGVPALSDFPDVSAAYSLLVVLLPLWSLSFAYFQLYHSRRTDSCFSDVLILLKGIALSTAVLAAMKFFYEPLPLSRSFLAPFLILNLVGLSAFRISMRLLLRRLRQSGVNVKRLLVVGMGPLVDDIVEKIAAHPFYGYRVIGVVGSGVRKSSQTLPRLGNVEDFPGCLEKQSVDEVIIALPFADPDTLRRIVSLCEVRGIHVRIVPDLFNIVKPLAQILNLDGIPLINARVYPSERVEYLFLKRVFDVVLSVLCLIALTPLLVMIGLGIRISSAGPILFRQERIGLNGRRFWMYKFRTMRCGCEQESDTRWTRPQDERVFPLGRFLRRTSLDELPQLLNVLRGNMSMVGPRPERPHFVEIFRREVPDYMIRHYMKCGITGWAQVNGWRGDTSIRKRIEFDLYYMQNWALWFDIKILLLTLARGLYQRNAY
jgi:Undecaprenyl-phosphate glucose phosphotransferase